MEEKKISYKIQGIELIEKIVLRANVDEDAVFNFNIKTQSVIPDNQANLIVVFIESSLNIVGQEQILARFFVGVGFQFETLKDALIEINDSKLEIPHELDTHLKSIGISTVRGIIYSELKGTHLNKAILPVIMMDSFLPVDESLVGVKVEDKKD